MKKLLFILGFLCSSLMLFSQDQGLPLFYDDDVLELRIEADFKEISLNHDDSTYFPARIQFVNKDGKLISKKIEVRSRGNFRRQKKNCSFPPLQLKFKPKKFKNTYFEGQKAIKLVTHCKKSKKNEQNILLEYLVYKSYNILTDTSFNVRLAKINYVFAGKKKDSIQRYAFFIERPKHLAKRLGGRVADLKRVHQDKTAYDHMNMLAIFQYMMGNTDWSVYNNHNVKFLSLVPGEPHVVVPYDFD